MVDAILVLAVGDTVSRSIPYQRTRYASLCWSQPWWYWSYRTCIRADGVSCLLARYRDSISPRHWRSQRWWYYELFDAKLPLAAVDSALLEPLLLKLTGLLRSSMATCLPASCANRTKPISCPSSQTHLAQSRREGHAFHSILDPLDRRTASVRRDHQQVCQAERPAGLKDARSKGTAIAEIDYGLLRWSIRESKDLLCSPV